jgi:flagellar basal-body rod protein FlgB
MNWVDSALNGHATALSLRSQRSEIIAGNITNADTPNFKSRDIDFRSEFESRLSGMQQLNTTAESQFKSSERVSSSNLMYRIPYQMSKNGNSVEAETEQAAYTKNAIQYQVSIQFLSSKISGLKLALKGE